MRRTTAADLAVPFVIFGITAWVLLRLAYGSIPPFQYSLPLPIAALSVVELVIARRVRSAVRHVPGAKPMTAIAIARCVALGKASSLVAAGVAGAAVALLVRVGPNAGSVRAAAADVRVGAVLFAASVLLCVAGLLLERAGIDPNSES
jgi:hypothetical protein